MKVERVLSRLSTVAERVTSSEVPLIGGRMRALERAGSSMRVASSEASTAVEVLERAGVQPESVDAVRRSARLLGRSPITKQQVDHAGGSLLDAVQQVRTTEQAALADARRRADEMLAGARRSLESWQGSPTAEQRAELAAAIAFPARDGFEQTALNIRLLDAIDDRTRELLAADIVKRPVAELSTDELYLMRAMTMPRQVGSLQRPIAPRFSSRMMEAVDGAIEGRPRRIAELQRHLAQRELEAMPDFERTRIAHELFLREPTTLEPRDWARLEAVLDLDRSQNFVVRLDGRPDLRDELALMQVQDRPLTQHVYDYFDVNAMPEASPLERAAAAERRFIDALDAAAAGNHDTATRDVLRAYWPTLGTYVRELPIERQARIASALLGIEGPSGNLQAVRSSLDSIRAAMDELPVTRELQPVYDETLVLLDRNIARMQGNHDPAAVRGYANHPDYAEVGRVKAGFDLLLAARPDADALQATRAAASSATERLVW